MDVERAIREYIDHTSDAAYIDRILEAAPRRSIFGILDRLLRSEHWDWHWAEPSMAVHFLTDACAYGKHRAEFRRALLRSRLITTLRLIGLNGHAHLRGQAVTAFDKIGGEQLVPILLAMFDQWFSADPFILQRILWATPIHMAPRRKWR